MSPFSMWHQKARHGHDGLVEACGETALPYRTVARWVRAFNEGRDHVENKARQGRPSVSEKELQTVSALLDGDRRQTVADRGSLPDMGGTGEIKYPGRTKTSMGREDSVGVVKPTSLGKVTLKSSQGEEGSPRRSEANPSRRYPEPKPSPHSGGWA
ncbi:hypothetical protein ANN_01466 [Periplaneta americana]|uniref:Mos1 transposase HTH domain-containing protein n=1 Tax=Periplaneta americana TaxID=6978 RepID=A0ABQ8TTQ7_PERAM|nr:hypothetical protein ANN_01466 [Periplaneta americana]